MKNKCLFICALFLATFAQAQELKLDVPNAKIGFYFHAKNVEGSLNGFKATVKFDPNHPETAAISGSVEVKTMVTGIEGRDHHLKTADFFDAEKYPTMSFSASKVEKSAAGYAVKGMLTIKDVKKEESFILNVEGGSMILKSTIYSSDYGIMKDKGHEGTQVDITITIPVI